MKRTATEWNRLLAGYAKPDLWQSIVQLVSTFLMLGVAIVTAYMANQVHWGLGFPASAVAGLIIVRVFIIQHDCGHRSFFKSPRTCDWVGRSLSVLTFTPYGFWRRDHDKHHATSGHLDKRGTGDVDTITVDEYLARDWRGRVSYRLYRHPAILFGLGPAFLYLLRNRLPVCLGRSQRLRRAAGIIGHDIYIAAFFGGFSLMFGWAAVALVWIPAILVAATLGIWLFYVQHQYEDTYWRRTEEWTFVDAALNGCSFYHLPHWLHYMTGWIGYHHIHHLSSRIPSYRLAKVFAEVPELREAHSITLLDSLKTLPLALWCERRGRLVSFSEAAA